MRMSEQINEISCALSKAQALITNASKDATNPHFRSKYATLSSVWDACREALTKQSIAVIQSPRSIKIEGVLCVVIETMLVHSTGQWIADDLSVPVSKADAQGVGSAITYARRYALAGMVGVCPDDDDGNDATTKTSTKPINTLVSEEQAANIKAIMNEVKADEKGLLHYFKTDSIESIQAKDYDRVIAALEKKREMA